MADRVSHYELLDKLGTGGMGTVWRARDSRQGDVVAIKLLHPHLAADAEYVRRFEREAQIARNIDSSNVVKVLDFGREGDAYFLAMEYVAGQTLADLIRERGRLSVDETVQIAASVARGLDAAHQRGIIHRDISPQNVILASGGEVKVTDFGVARDLAQTSITATSMLLGKPQYVAPEVVTAKSRPDIRSDLYALGIVTYQMLTGAPPFNADTPYGVLQKQVSEAATPIARVRRDIPPWLAATIDRCLAKQPGDRFQDPGALIRVLESKEAPPAPPVASDVRRRPRRALTLPLIGGALGLLFVVTVFGLVLASGSGGDGTNTSSVPASSGAGSDTTQPAAQPYRIGGTVYADWNKNGSQEPDEQGIPGASLFLFGSTHATAVTDAFGRYTFENLSAGTYSIQLSIAPNHEATSIHPVLASLTQDIPDTVTNLGVAPIQQSSPGVSAPQPNPGTTQPPQPRPQPAPFIPTQPAVLPAPSPPEPPPPQPTAVVAPKILGLGCPAVVRNASDTFTCNPAINGENEKTSFRWEIRGSLISASSQYGRSFSASLGASSTVILTACNGSACDRMEASVQVQCVTNTRGTTACVG